MSFYGQDPYGYGIYGQPSYYPPYPAQQQQQQQQPPYYSSSTYQRRKPRAPKDNIQMWCDICGVGCIGQQSYAEHCNGKKHQLLARKSQSSAPPDPNTASPAPSQQATTTMSGSSSTVRFSPYEGGATSPTSDSKSQGKYYCEICQVYSTDQNTFNLHLTGKKHKTIMQRSGKTQQGPLPTAEGAQEHTTQPLQHGASFVSLPRYHIPSAPKSSYTPILVTNPSNIADDNLLNSKLKELSPTAENLVPLSNLVQVVLNKLGEFKLPQPEGADEQPIVLDVTMVGPYARQTLMKGNLHADIVVVTKDPPDAAMLSVFEKALRETMQEASIERDTDNLHMRFGVPGNISVNLMFTWADALDVQGSDFASAQPNMPPSPPSVESLVGVNVSACQQALLKVRQMYFFSDNSLSPNLRPCLKILKDLRNRMPVFAPLNNWAIEVIIINALRTLPLSASLSQSMRAIFAFMASGMLLPGVEFMDPCAQEAESVLRNISNEARLEITSAAQKILNDIAFGKWEEILGL